jgi:hypothetical protein
LITICEFPKNFLDFALGRDENRRSHGTIKLGFAQRAPNNLSKTAQYGKISLRDASLPVNVRE